MISTHISIFHSTFSLFLQAIRTSLNAISLTKGVVCVIFEPYDKADASRYQQCHNCQWFKDVRTLVTCRRSSHQRTSISSPLPMPMIQHSRLVSKSPRLNNVASCWKKNPSTSITPSKILCRDNHSLRQRLVSKRSIGSCAMTVGVLACRLLYLGTVPSLLSFFVRLVLLLTYFTPSLTFVLSSFHPFFNAARNFHCLLTSVVLTSPLFPSLPHMPRLCISVAFFFSYLSFPWTCSLHFFFSLFLFLQFSRLISKPHDKSSNQLSESTRVLTPLTTTAHDLQG